MVGCRIWCRGVLAVAGRCGTFTSVPDLNAKIRAFITGWNARAHPFTWTKTADQILTKANRQTTSNAVQ
ncbi:transposase [Tersicoccus phoenicis]|uniref:Transposase n=1 Tax=Tersicoccus phoenicis TaxID=554083 RepID=A0A1R1LBT9_9MICC|nr:transposase [Tersicoccus phoenicis]